MTPSCVAARPMPSESCMIWPIRRTSSTRPASKVSTSRARLRRTGSPCVRTNRSAASRRARVSGSSLSSCASDSSSRSSFCATTQILGARRYRLGAAQDPHGLAALLLGDAVEHEHAVEVVELVLEHARLHSLRFHEALPPVGVVAAHAHVL